MAEASSLAGSWVTYMYKKHVLADMQGRARIASQRRRSSQEDALLGGGTSPPPPCRARIAAAAAGTAAAATAAAAAAAAGTAAAAADDDDDAAGGGGDAGGATGVARRSSPRGRSPAILEAEQSCESSRRSGSSLSHRAVSIPTTRGTMGWRKGSGSAGVGRSADPPRSLSMPRHSERGENEVGDGDGSAGDADDEGDNEVLARMTQQIADNFTTMKEALHAASRASRESAADADSGGGLSRADRPRASSVSASPQLMTMLMEIYTTEDNYVQAGPPVFVNFPAAAPAPPPPRRADRPLTPRRFVLSQDLRFLVRSFVHPLRDVNLLPSDDMSAIFCNVEQLLELHEGLVAEIAAACGGGGGGGGGGQPLPLQQTADVLRRIADAFARRMAFFKLYSMYCSNFVFSSSRLSCVRETLPAVQQLLTEVEGQYQTTALGLMIRPVQRVCQYPLLFREVLKHLQNDDPGAADFARMVGQMEETIETVNEKVRAQENGLRMRGILTAELQARASPT